MHSKIWPSHPTGVVCCEMQWPPEDSFCYTHIQPYSRVYSHGWHFFVNQRCLDKALQSIGQWNTRSRNHGTTTARYPYSSPQEPMRGTRLIVVEHHWFTSNLPIEVRDLVAFSYFGLRRFEIRLVMKLRITPRRFLYNMWSLTLYTWQLPLLWGTQKPA